TSDLLAAGGWLYVTLPATTDVGPMKIWATRVPPLSAPRGVFTPALFPVADTVPPGPYDDLFQEAEDYNDGFVRVAHAAQPRTIDPLHDDDDGPRPAKEAGVQVGWDDEQVTVWLNRQIDPAAATLDAPLGVHGYRIDVREGTSGPWSSLCHAAGPLT